MDAVNVARLQRYDQIGETVKIGKTPDSLVCNNLRVKYALNPDTGAYEAEIIRDHTNSPGCEKSYAQYGEREQRAIALPDVQEAATAAILANRYVSLYAFRHDIVERETPVWAGFDVLEGDGGLLTVIEGSSSDGAGWVDEPCILLDRQFKDNTLYQRWWRMDTD